MESLLYSFLAGTSTVLGAILLLIFGTPKKKMMATILGFAAGIMLAISLFELLPQSYTLSNLYTSIIGFVLGCALMYSLDIFLPHAHLSSSDDVYIENPDKMKPKDSNILRTGYLIFFGIALHNIPEGLAIGAGLEASPDLGLYIAVAIGLHNIPEGLAVAGPLKVGGVSNLKMILFTLSAGLTTVIGTAIGLLILNISPMLVGGSLAFAAGAMVYIVIDELIPQANSLHNHLSNLGLIVGLLIGFVLF